MTRQISFIILCVFIHTVCRSQEIEDIVIIDKADQYYVSLANKPDSLEFITCSYIQNKLLQNEAYVDVCQATISGTQKFAVVIVTKNFKTVITIPTLDSAVSKEEKNAVDSRSSLVKKRTSSEKEYYGEFKNFFSYIKSYLKGIKTIYYSSGGVLNEINIKFFKDEDGSFLFKKYDLIRLHTAVSFIGNRHKLIMPAKMNVLLVGNVFYDCDNSTNPQKSWNYLPGTKSEVEKIINTIRPKHNYVLLDSCSSTEINFKNTVNKNSFDIIHLATHGFHFKNSDNVAGISASTHPLMLTGIVLSGANRLGTSVNAFDESGLYTTFDFKNLKLKNLKMVVLSTCHSGEGFESSAPIGISLAFLRQGVQAMIVSNRAVPDNESYIFMATFYKNLLKSEDVDKCYLSTIKELVTSFPNTKWDFFDLVH